MTNASTLMSAILAAALAAGCFSERTTGPGDTTPCTSSATNDCVVAMNDNAFAPATMRVTAGSTVTWRNQGASPHTSTGADWDSETVMPGAEFERAFPAAGTFDYECVFHPGMEGTVVVE
ncbi:MAG TPA: cupredoxin domain-containing protein [Longimicrobiales bacterium]